MGKEDGVKGKEFGILGVDDGVLGGEFGKLCPKESQFLGQVTSMALHMEMASEKYDTPGEAPIQVNIQMVVTSLANLWIISLYLRLG